MSEPVAPEMAAKKLKLEHKEIACPVCHSPKRKLFGPVDSSVIANAKDFSVARCEVCSFWYCYPMPKLTPEVLTNLYDYSYFDVDATNRGDWQYDFNHTKDDKNVLLWLSLLRSNKSTSGDRLLDVGCGRGVFMAIAKSVGWDTYGFDVTETNRQMIADNCGIKISTGGSPSQHFENGFFDAIFCKDVLEHQQDPQAFMVELRDLLKPGGSMFLAFPNEDALMNKWIRYANLMRGLPATSLQPLDEPFHVVGFTSRSFDRLVSKLGLKKAWLRKCWGPEIFARPTSKPPTSLKGRLFQRTLYWTALLGDKLNQGRYFQAVLKKTALS